MTTRIRLLALALALTGALLSVPAATATGGHHANKAPHQLFLLLTNNPSSDSGGSIAGFGAIHAKGIDKVVNGHTDHFVFPKGYVVVKHHRIGKPGGHFDKKNCYGSFTEHGAWKASGGTGAYASASGGGTYKVTGQIIGCKKTPEVFQLQIKAVGNLAL